MSRRSLPLLAVAIGLLAPATAPAAAAPASPAATAPANPYVVVLRDSVERVDAAIERREQARHFHARLRFRHAVKGFSARLNEAQVAALRADPNVVSVTRDRPVRALAEIPLAAGEPVPPPGVRRIGAATEATAREAADGAVAVIDTGIDLAHPDLDAAAGTNCVTPGAAPADDDGHGTHVAGTIAARNDGGGVTGVAPGTKVYAVKVLDGNGEGTWSQVICGIDWVTANAAKLGIAVANLSLGGPGSDDGDCGRSDRDALHRAICRAADAGVLAVVAAGNDGVDAAGDAPASYREVLTVTAMADRDGSGGGAGGRFCGERDDTPASFSNFVTSAGDAAHTVAAPGVCIRSTLPGGTWGGMSGTSMAAPHVAGAVALCIGEAGVAGPCAGLAPARIVEHVIDRATARASDDATWGFTGDPLRPLTGKVYGHLVDASWVAPTATAPAAEDPVAAPGDPAGQPPPAGEPQAPAGAEPAEQPLPEAPGPATEPAPPAATVPAIAVTVRSRRLRRVLRRGLRLRVRCTPACAAPVQVRVALGSGARLARLRRVTADRTTVLRLPRRTRRRLAGRAGVRLAVHASAPGAIPAAARVRLR